MIASEVFLGVKPASEYLYCVIASPAGAYFKGGVKPITVWISEDYTRAAPGGTGAAKCGGNYAASLAPHAEALEHGCDQVIFLDAVERRYVDELGGMNVFFVMDDNTMVTPPLTGTILPGITRDALITLAAERGVTTVERPYSMDEWRADAASGRLREAFACGTAAVITPIGFARSRTETITIDGGEPGGFSTGLRTDLVDIQRGAAEDTARLGAPGRLSLVHHNLQLPRPRRNGHQQRRRGAIGAVLPLRFACQAQCVGRRRGGLRGARDPYGDRSAAPERDRRSTGTSTCPASVT